MPAGGKFGRLQPAPENFISTELIDDIRDHGLNDSRREFLRKSLAAASAALAAGTSLAAWEAGAEAASAWPPVTSC